jgi:hypothetical protein
LTERVEKLIDGEVLEIQLAHRYANREDHNKIEARSFRFVAYRQEELVYFLFCPDPYPGELKLEPTE